MMSYQSAETGSAGRWQQYEDCKNQLATFGTQGNTILLGWIENNDTGFWSDWYTSDAAGFERFLDDVRIAQAAGMKEIVSAWLHDLTIKWGDAAILRIDEVLNHEPKKGFDLTAPTQSFNVDVLADYLENFNRPWLFTAIMATCVIMLILKDFSMKPKHEKI